MKISKTAYQFLLELPTPPPETGGILGGTTVSVDHIIVDTRGNHSEGKYAPNVDFLNRCIWEWGNQGISFLGFFHTHAQNWKGLSLADREYIQAVMLCMPKEIDTLFFPVVYPSLCVQGYSALKIKNHVHIVPNHIEVVERR